MSECRRRSLHNIVDIKQRQSVQCFISSATETIDILNTNKLDQRNCLIGHLNTRPQLHMKNGEEISFHVFLEKFSVEITSDGVVDEALRSLSLAASLVLENHIIIPSEQIGFRE